MFCIVYDVVICEYIYMLYIARISRLGTDLTCSRPFHSYFLFLCCLRNDRFVLKICSIGWVFIGGPRLHFALIVYFSLVLNQTYSAIPSYIPLALDVWKKSLPYNHLMRPFDVSMNRSPCGTASPIVHMYICFAFMYSLCQKKSLRDLNNHFS